MVKKAQRVEMRDYVVEKLRAAGLTAEPRRKALSKSLDFETNYIIIGKNEGVILLIGEEYPHNSFRQIYEGAGSQIPNHGALVFKDGETFFRNAAHGGKAGLTGVRYKQTKDLSLKNYSSEQINKMIALRPEEKYLASVRNGLVQYYQPDSERLGQGIVTFRFKPVIYDYSHVSNSRFVPSENESERLKVWDAKFEALRCPIKLENCFVKAADPVIISSLETRPDGYFPGRDYAVGEREN